MDKRLLEILCCPISRVPVRSMQKKELAALNKAIEEGQVQFVDGSPVTDSLTEGLITEDRKVIYRIEDDIPVMLPDQGIGTTQLAPDAFD